jgi:hypothetical protein
MGTISTDQARPVEQAAPTLTETSELPLTPNQQRDLNRWVERNRAALDRVIDQNPDGSYAMPDEELNKMKRELLSIVGEKLKPADVELRVEENRKSGTAQDVRLIERTTGRQIVEVL